VRPMWPRDGDGVSGLQELRPRALEADAGRRAGGDDVPRLQLDELRDVRHEPRDAVEHVRRVRALLLHAAHRRDDGERVRVGHLVGRREVGTERAGGVEVLALRVLRDAELVVAHGHIVEDRVAHDVGHGVRLHTQEIRRRVGRGLLAREGQRLLSGGKRLPASLQQRNHVGRDGRVGQCAGRGGAAAAGARESRVCPVHVDGRAGVVESADAHGARLAEGDELHAAALFLEVIRRRN
jgi:hypothetical protein